MKLNELLNTLEILKKIDPKEVNTRTAYWQARNIRTLTPFADLFETSRKSILSDSWFVEYQEATKEDETKANEKYKDQLKLASEEISQLLEKEHDLTPFQISIEDYNGPTDMIFNLYDLISEA